MEKSQWIVLYQDQDEELVIIDIPETVDEIVDNGTYSEAVIYAELALDEWVERVHSQKHGTFAFQTPFAQA
ncbi:hypothetical protein U27_02378 [Candidatus Vecturithrix granuli]|uniref:HicB-like antitoxin of toxin-antitoxin system domain-containing protein n=1 Tax=Vecturithrix granuli TaxID=1499967 RepID=A0A0S6W7A0_VECG1|nr:hypothetical protein U27_02378 [Candidatus Vecturithrix granuli]